MGGLLGLLSGDVGVNLQAVSLVEGQGLLNLGQGQVVLGGDLGRCELPVLVRDGYRLHAHAGAPQHRGRQAAGPAPVGDVGKGRVVELLAEGAHLFGHGPQDELVKGYTLVGGPLLRRG